MENSLCTQKCVQCQAGVEARADMSEALFVQLQGSIVSVSFVVLWVLDCQCFRYLLFLKLLPQQWSETRSRGRTKIGVRFYFCYCVVHGL